MAQTFSTSLLPSSTGIDLGSSSQRWDLYGQTLDISGTVTFAGTFNVAKLEDIRFADQFSGGSVTAKIDAALADASTLLVLVPSSMAAGNATSISSGKCILDLRSGVPKFFTNYSTSAAALTLNNDGTLTSVAFKSISTNPSATGIVRLANADAIKSRNAGNSADLNIANMNSSNVLVLGDAGGISVSGPVTGITSLTLSGVLSGVTTGSFSGQVTSSLATGTAPFSIASTTVVPNLNVATLNGVTVSGSASAGQVLTASSASAASWSAASTSSILDKQDVIGAKTGDATDQTIYTYTMPVNTLAAAKGIRVTAITTHSTGSASVTYKLFFGASSVSLAGATITVLAHNGLVFNNSGSTVAQWMSYYAVPTGGGVTNRGTGAETTTSGTIVVKLTFNVAATDQVTPQGWLVELVS